MRFDPVRQTRQKGRCQTETVIKAILPVLGVLFALAHPVAAGVEEDICAARAAAAAKSQSERRAGGVNLRISGNVAVGFSRSSGPQPKVPAGAGDAAREARELRALEERVKRECMQDFSR